MTFVSVPATMSNDQMVAAISEPVTFQQSIPARGPPRPRRSVKLPRKPIEQHPHFVCLVVDEDGSIQIRASPFLKQFRHLLLDEAHSKLRGILNDLEHPQKVPKQPDSYPPVPAFLLQQGATVTFSPGLNLDAVERPPKRQRPPGMKSAVSFASERPSRKSDARVFGRGSGERNLTIRVDDRAAQEKWFSDAFRAVQQVGCRLIAKVWIKKIHPKKQSTHPYNGAHPRDQPASPNRTRPPYWPTHVIHKEPDHIDRNARTALLVHLIMNTPQPQITTDSNNQRTIDAKQLLEALEEKKNDFKADRWPIVEEIVKARAMVEQFEDDACGPDFTMCLVDFSDNSRVARGESDLDIADNDGSAPETSDPGPHGGLTQFNDLEGTPPSSSLPSPIACLQNEGHRTSSQEPHAGYPAGLDTVDQLQTGSQCGPQPFSNPQGSNGEHACHFAHQESSLMDVEDRRFESELDSATRGLDIGHGLNRRELMILQSRNPHHHHEGMMHHWATPISHGMFISTPYPDLIHVQPPLGPRSHLTSDPMTLRSSSEEGMNDQPHGLPMMENIGYQDYHAGVRRSLPFRSTPTSHSGMMGTGHNELDMMSEVFY